MLGDPRRHPDARKWATKFGSNYRALFVFSYYIVSPDLPAHNNDTLWTWQDRQYLLRAIPVDDFAEVMQRRSDKWSTVYLRTADFQRLVRPLPDYLPELNWVISRGAEERLYSPAGS